MRPYFPLFVITAVCLATCNREVAPVEELIVIEASPEETTLKYPQLREQTNLTVEDDLAVSLWAGGKLVEDPIAISFAPDGRLFYTQANRQRNSEFDIRGHMDWTEESLSFQTPEDKRAFLRETFTKNSQQSLDHLEDLNRDTVKDYRDLAVEEEQVWVISDRDGDGRADRTQRFLSDFADEVTDVANGVAFINDRVYVAAAPNLWRADDTDGNGAADEITSISHGFGVHIGFGGHGMSGVKVGPQGRIWWGIGDIGSNVVDKTGQEWSNPNRGVIVRCDPDGSNFEVFAHGVRNTHEFDFDKYGNLITVDNDGDHPGERERLVYLVDGSDTGWRINWQFGKYTDPKNNAYKVWMDEKMYLPDHEEHAAYFLPAIEQFVNGPTGLVYNPGTALSPAYYDHFFVAEFRGSPNNSPVHAFRMEPDGAGFQLGSSKEIVRGALPTGLDFGPDGSLYFADWINGWGPKDEGRIWKVTAAEATGTQQHLQAEVEALLATDFSETPPDELKILLGHQDRRIRRNAQSTLVARGKRAQPAFIEVLDDTGGNQLARLHALWGLAQLARTVETDASFLTDYLDDVDDEIVAQVAKMIGDLRYTGATEPLIALLSHPSPRARYFAMEALGRTAAQDAIAGILEVVRSNTDGDAWVRHGAMIALGRIGNAEAMARLAGAPSREVRLTAIVALRRMQSPLVDRFLDDADEYVVAEAARAITDDERIPGAMESLAQLLNERPWSSEPLIRRAINANLQLGDQSSSARLIEYAGNVANPPTMRAEALLTIGGWREPSVFDRVDGRYRKLPGRDHAVIRDELVTALPPLVARGHPAVRSAAIAAAGSLQLGYMAAQLGRLVKAGADADIRAEALAALSVQSTTDVPDLKDLLLLGLRDNNERVRRKALTLLPQSSIEPAAAVDLYRTVLERGNTGEGQAALAALSDLKGGEAEALLADLFADMKAGALSAALHLDLVAAIESNGSDELIGGLTAYEQALLAEDSLGLYAQALVGGDAAGGYGLFTWNSTAQCTRCHAIFEYGGNVGPNLSGVGSRLSPKEILTSIVYPSAALAPGHETVLLTLAGDSLVSGVVYERTEEQLTILSGKSDRKTFSRADIVEEEILPSSMPSYADVLTKSEIRDIVAYLATVKEEHQ